MNTNIDTVIFDLGKVVIDFSWSRTIQMLEDKVPNDLNFSLETFSNSSLLHQFERGEITQKKFGRDICQRFRGAITPAEFFDAFNNIFLGVFPAVHTMLARLQGNVQLLALTNINDAHYQYCWEHYEETLLLFDHIIASHEVGKRKPEYGIYKHMNKRYEVSPEKAIYLDDLSENIEAGKMLGYQCIHVKNIDIALQELQFMLEI
jgi:putative hydrolase of the HAD superfamily